MRDTFAKSLYELGKADPKVAIVVADISPAGSMAAFCKEFPERFINVGVAEQSMIGMCAGLAMRGIRPFAYTIATFSIYRPFEFVRDDLAYQNLPVTVVGIGGGVCYSLLGGTHHAQEDVAVMSAIPNMSVLAPCDPLEVEAAVRVCGSTSGPLYLRMGKAGEPRLTENAPDPFVFGKLRTIRRDGNDVCILSYGPIMKMALDVADRLSASGRRCSVVSAHTLKPFDDEGIARIVNGYSTVVVIEEHAPQGGLASRVKEAAWDNGARCRLFTFTLQDKFIHTYGSHAELLRAHGLDADRIVSVVSAQ